MPHPIYCKLYVATAKRPLKILVESTSVLAYQRAVGTALKIVTIVLHNKNLVKLPAQSRLNFINTGSP